MARKRTDKEWAACVGLVRIGYWRRYECWNDIDIVERKWPLHLRYLPPKWVTYSRDGAILNLPWRKKCYGTTFKDLSLEKVIKPY